MASLETTIRNTKTLQDIELAEAMNRLKSNPAELRAWLQSQQERVYNDIVKQKEDTFNKVYGDFQRASKVEESILMHNKRAKELSDMVDSVYQNQETAATAILQDKNLASRKHEMNEWSVGNKQDTRLGLISSALWVGLATPMIIIFILVALSRWRYTDTMRNKRYWNKKIFEGKSQKINIPSCPQMVDAAASIPSFAGVTNPSM
jgi:hypothetical protein